MMLDEKLFKIYNSTTGEYEKGCNRDIYYYDNFEGAKRALGYIRGRSWCNVKDDSFEIHVFKLEQEEAVKIPPKGAPKNV